MLENVERFQRHAAMASRSVNRREVGSGGTSCDRRSTSAVPTRGTTMTRLAHIVLASVLAAAFSVHAGQAAPPKIWTGPPIQVGGVPVARIMTHEALKTVSDGLVLQGNMAYNRSGSMVTLSADGVYNNSSTRTSGTMRLELWATTTKPARGAAFNGYRLAISPTFSPLSPGFHYSSLTYTVSFVEPPAGTYWIVFALDEFNNCSTNDGYCLEDSLVFDNQQTFGSAPPPPPTPQLGLTARSFGSRGTVSSSARMYGAFELASSGTVFILVRGNSLGTLGVTQGYLDAPRVQLFNAQGSDLVSQGGLPGFNDCLASNTVTDYPVVYYYGQLRGQPVSERDSCYTTTLPAGVYTFSVNPSILGVTSNATSSSPAVGEVLFEVTLVQ